MVDVRSIIEADFCSDERMSVHARSGQEVNTSTRSQPTLFFSGPSRWAWCVVHVLVCVFLCVMAHISSLGRVREVGRSHFGPRVLSVALRGEG